MVQRYNSPPNWPTPPAGWTPAPGWEPDQAWGPAPEGWQLFVDDIDGRSRKNKRTLKIFGGAAGALILIAAIGAAAGDDDGDVVAAATSNSASPTPKASDQAKQSLDAEKAAEEVKASAKAQASDDAKASAEAKAAADTQAAADAAAAAKEKAAKAAANKPLIFTGHGDKIIKFKKPFTDIRLMTTTWTGADTNITAYSIMPDGTEGDLLVNAIDRYRGQTLFNTDSDNAVGIKMSGNGTWTVKISPMSAAHTWDGTGTYSGASDGVIVVRDAFEPVDSIKFISSRADTNVTMYAYTDDGDEELVVNDIDNFSGEFLVPNDSVLFVVSSDGNWTIKKS